jgi:hypothetical protein
MTSPRRVSPGFSTAKLAREAYGENPWCVAMGIGSPLNVVRVARPFSGSVDASSPLNWLWWPALNQLRRIGQSTHER